MNNILEEDEEEESVILTPGIFTCPRFQAGDQDQVMR
jgi:orotidine-5'-phosphate decarboxylase